MRKKIVLMALALFLILATNLNVCCKLVINGRELDGLYSPAALDRCRTVAAAAAEEILPLHAVEPQLQKRYCLSFYKPEGGLSIASDAILRAYSGVKTGDGVYVNGVFLGVVEDGELIKEKLKSYIKNQMPNRAVFGSISGELDIRGVYTRIGKKTNDEDMLLLISGMAPVIYLDAEGRLA